MSKKYQYVLITSLILLFIISCLAYLHYQKYYPSTVDAYLQANVVTMAAQVSGPVSATYVENHSYVHVNQPLFDIDPKPFIIAVQQAQANLENTQQQIHAAQEAVTAAQALVAQRQAEYSNAQKDAYRITTLVKKHLAAVSEGDKATSQFKVAKAALAAANSQLHEAEAKLGNPGENNTLLRMAVAKLKQAQLNLQYTHIIAPADGFIINFSLRSGTMISAQQPLFSLIENNRWWVDANFKETDLARIKVGQPAKIEVDMYPGYSLKGIVQSISSGSGAAFSILPPENATGNWVKVTQRMTVRVNIINPSSHYPLRVGASSKVTINTH